MAGQFTKVIATDADFEAEVLKSPIPLVVHWSATWSGPCKTQAPIVDKVGEENQSTVKCVEVDIDACTEVCKKYSIKSVPTVTVFKGGNRSAHSVGITSREKILEMVGL